MLVHSHRFVFSWHQVPYTIQEHNPLDHPNSMYGLAIGKQRGHKIRLSAQMFKMCLNLLYEQRIF